MKLKIIPIFIPHLGCFDHCIYCDQKGITGINAEISTDVVQERIETYFSQILTSCPGISSANIQIAFFGGNFTGLDPAVQESLLEISKSYVEKKLVDSVRISTRPDFLNQDILSFLKERYVRTIEIGVQSLDDEVLSQSGRNYHSEDVLRSFKRLRENRFQVGIQLMLGLPEDTPEKIKETVRTTINLKPDFVRLYPTLVIQGTALEKLYQEGKYRPMRLDEILRLCKAILLNLEMHQIPVIRLGLHPSESLMDRIVDGPFHPALKHLVKSEISYDLISLAFKKHPKPDYNRAVFYVPRGSLSEFKGYQKENIRKTETEFKVRHVDFVEQEEIMQGTLKALLDDEETEVHKKDLMALKSYHL